MRPRGDEVEPAVRAALRLQNDALVLRTKRVVHADVESRLICDHTVVERIVQRAAVILEEIALLAILAGDIERCVAPDQLAVAEAVLVRVTGLQIRSVQFTSRKKGRSTKRVLSCCWIEIKVDASKRLRHSVSWQRELIVIHDPARVAVHDRPRVIEHVIRHADPRLPHLECRRVYIAAAVPVHLLVSHSEAHRQARHRIPFVLREICVFVGVDRVRWIGNGEIDAPWNAR